MTTRTLNNAIKELASKNKTRKGILPDVKAEIAIEFFLNDNFVSGKYAFKEFSWVNECTLRIKDINGCTALVHYDRTTKCVTLR